MASTPRYSDRFFGVTGPAAEHPAALAGDGPDEVDVADGGRVGPDEPGAAGTRLQRWRAPIAIGVAFALGAAGGAYGWNRWSDHTATAAAMSAVEITTSVISSAVMSDGAQASVEFVNNGSYDVEISEPVFVDAAITTGDMTPFPVPAGARTTRVLPVTIDCNIVGDGTTWRPTGGLRAEVTTADGGHHRVTITGGENDAVQLAVVGSGCHDPDQPPDLYLSTSSVSVSDADGGLGGDGTTDGGGGLVIVSHLVLGDAYSFGGPVPRDPSTVVVIDSVEAGLRGAYTVTTDPALPATLSPGDQISVTWQLGSCDQAMQATVEDMTVTFTYSTYSAADPTVERIVSADVPTDLGIALAQLAAQHCG